MKCWDMVLNMILKDDLWQVLNTTYGVHGYTPSLMYIMSHPYPYHVSWNLRSQHTRLTLRESVAGPVLETALPALFEQ